MLSINVFRGASEQHLIQDRSLARNIDSKNAASGFDCCPRAARRRLYRQHRPKADIRLASAAAARALGRDLTKTGDDGLANAWSYLFSRLLALPVDFAGPWEPTFVLLLPASTAARRVSALSVRAPSRALCAALRWLARRFISFALCAPRIGSSIASAGESTFSPLTSVV